MSVATSPGIRTGITSQGKLISLEDFQDAIDRIDPAETPFWSLCQTERALIAEERAWNVDSMPSVKGARGRADNETAPASASTDSEAITTNIRKMGNVAQGFSRTWRLGWVLKNLPKIAGVKDPQAYGEATFTKMIKLDAEAAMTSMDQAAVYDASPGLGAVMSGYRKLTDYANKYAAASVYAVGKPTDIHYAPTGACPTGALTTVHNRALWKTIAVELRTAAKKNGDWMLLCGLTLRQAITDLTRTAAATGNYATGASAYAGVDQVNVYTRQESDNTIGATVDIIQTDFGRFMVATSDYIGTTTTDSTGGALASVYTATAHRALAAHVPGTKDGIIVKKGNVFKAWGMMPATEELGADGGGKAFDTKALMTFGVKNPILAGWLLLT